MRALGSPAPASSLLRDWPGFTPSTLASVGIQIRLLPISNRVVALVSILTGESTPSPADGSAEQTLSKLEISLTLTSKFDVVEASGEETDAKSLLLR